MDGAGDTREESARNFFPATRADGVCTSAFRRIPSTRKACSAIWTST